MSEIKLYLSTQKGTEKNSKHIEYEFVKKGMTNVLAIFNAVVIDEEYLRVDDIGKPVYFIAKDILGCECIYEVGKHMRGKASGAVNAQSVKSSACEAQVLQRMFNNGGGDSGVRIKLRRGDTAYCAGDIREETGEIHRILLDDVLMFVAKEISWDDLAERSDIFHRAMEAEKSKEERISELEDRVESIKSAMTENLKKYEELCKRLESVPGWILCICGLLSAELRSNTWENCWVRRSIGSLRQKNYDFWRSWRNRIARNLRSGK